VGKTWLGEEKKRQRAVESLREHNRQFNTFNFEWTQFFMNNTAQI
jgi:hypothetical protein